ncbi:MAG: GTP 3',8-cyclase MoaA [Lachnospiraceae bacterium]|nr:GTP 3',8-cyclase MoaA [Lachnospiraceae bacterium]
MRDTFNREIKYLRISLTELCNLRCRYCMPENGICKKSHDEMMTYEEIIQAVKIASRLGVSKIRLTGGEPLVKSGIVSLVSKIKEIDGIDEVCITTNGTLLTKYARELKNAGLDRLNISLDTLNPEKFRYITRVGKLNDTLKGIDVALNEGFKKVKINTVLIGGFNDDEIVDLANLTMTKPLDVRFIELMPMYDSGDFGKEAFISSDIVIDKINEYYKNKMNADDMIFPVEADNGSVAKKYKIKGALGNVGLISAVSNSFCSKCNRIRLTADGKLKPCLHSNQEILIKGLNEKEMEMKFKEAILLKPEKHDVLSYESRSHADRNMNQIGG